MRSGRGIALFRIQSMNLVVGNCGKAVNSIGFRSINCRLRCRFITLVGCSAASSSFLLRSPEKIHHSIRRGGGHLLPPGIILQELFVLTVGKKTELDQDRGNIRRL